MVVIQAKRRQVLTIIWAAMMGSYVLHVIVGVIVATQIKGHRAIPAAYDTGLLAAIAVLGALALSVTIWWRRRAFESLAGAGSDAIFTRFQAAYVTCWGIGQIPAVAGLVTTLLTFEVQFVIVGAAVSLLLTGLVLRPDFSVLEQASRTAGVPVR